MCVGGGGVRGGGGVLGLCNFQAFVVLSKLASTQHVTPTPFSSPTPT